MNAARVIATGDHAHALTVGQLIERPTKHAIIRCRRIPAGYLVTVHHLDYTEVPGFTSGPWTTPDQAGRAFDNAVSEFTCGRTIAQVTDATVNRLTHELHAVQRRRETWAHRRANQINAILDRFDTPADKAALAELADSIARGNALRDLAEHGTPAQVQPLRSGAATDITNPVERAVAIAAETGFVARGGQPGQAPLNVLIAAARPGRDLLTLTYKPGTRVVTGAAVTERGRRHHNNTLEVSK